MSTIQISAGGPTMMSHRAWTGWCQKVAADIELPSGRIHRAARGAEQGDPHGSLQAGLVLARCVREALADVSAQRGEKPHAFTMWFADDGQLICRPADVHDILVALDAALARAGATRGTVPDAKTVARLVGHPEALLAHAADPRNAEWATDHGRATCHIGEPNCDRGPGRHRGHCRGPRDPVSN